MVFLSFFWLCWVSDAVHGLFLAVCRLSLVAESKGYPEVAAQGLLIASGLLSWSTGSGACRQASVAAAHGLLSSGPVAVVHALSYPAACGIRVLGSGIKPVSPALAEGLLTTGTREVPVFQFL